MAIKGKSAKGKGVSLNTLPGGKLNNFLNNASAAILNFRKSKNFYVALAAAVIVLLVIYKKEWFVAAMVNGSPLTNFELQSRLNQQFRSQTLNQLINEKIIFNEAGKFNISVLPSEIDAKLAEIESSIGGKEALDAMLAQQGQTRDSVRQQLRLQITIEKLYAKEATVSAEEVNKFVEDNKEQLRATDSAAQTKEAEELLRNQKLSQIFSQKFQELRTRAKIQIF